jgi:Lrp/AsnC family transcriptional regulator
VYKQLIKAVPLSDVSASFAMEQIKYSTALPVRDDANAG